MSEAINMHNSISTENVVRHLERAARTLFKNPKMAHTIPAIMLRGAPGVGKSTMVKATTIKLAKELKRDVGFIDIRLANMERVDFAGLPSVENGTTHWNIPEFWPRDPKSCGIILLDEITSAPADVQVAAYSVVLDRKIPNSNYALPDGWLIVAAGNRLEDGAVAKAMSSALANRFMHFEVDANVEDFSKYALQHDIHHSVIGFLNFRPELLLKLDKTNRERGWPSPRSWEKLSSMIPLYEDDEGLLTEAVNSLVGNNVGVEFMAFYKLNQNYDNVLELMTNPKKEIKLPAHADQRYAMASACTYLLWNGKDKKDEQLRIDGFFRICMEMPSDLCVVMVKLAMAGNSRITPIEACMRLMKSKNYAEAAKKCGNKVDTKQYKL